MPVADDMKRGTCNGRAEGYDQCPVGPRAEEDERDVALERVENDLEREEASVTVARAAAK